MMAPKARQLLSADALFGMLRTGCADIAAHRPGDTDIALTDALMSALALFSLQSPSLLAFDKARTEGNVHRVYGRERGPCDTAMRERLDPVAPEALRPLGTDLLRALQRGTALAAMVCVEGHSLCALEGTGSFASPQMPDASCWATRHRTGTGTSRQHMLSAALVHPDKRAVMPLRPEPSIKHDGADKNACERNAAKRLRAKLRQAHPHLKVLVTADSLSAHAPHLEGLQDHHLHSSLGVKEGDQASVFAPGAAAEGAGRVRSYAREDAQTGRRHRLRCLRAVPLKEAHGDRRGKVLEGWEWHRDQVYHCSWGPDLRVNKGTVSQRMRGGRARWRSAHETCHTLTNQGYHCAHNDGHGAQPLSGLFAVLMLLACVVDQVPRRCCPLCQAVWAKLGSQRRLWEKRRALCDEYALESMRHLCEALLDGWKKTAPMVALDAAEALRLALRDDEQSHAPAPCRDGPVAPSSRRVAALKQSSAWLARKKVSRKPGIGGRWAVARH